MAPLDERKDQVSKELQVLIIEDSQDDALLLVREIKRGGYEPAFERVDTPSAMETALKQKRWDIIISDYAMPHFSAPAALALLKENGLDLPFIIVSGKIGEETAVAAMKAGAHDYIMKDNLERLAPTIERELKNAEIRRERRRSEESLKKSTRALKTLSECNEALVREKTESELLNKICRIITEKGDYRLAWVGFAEQDKKKTVRPVAQSGYERGYLDTINITWADSKRGRGPTGTAIRTGKPSIARNILTEPGFIPWHAEAKKRGYASSISIPLINEEQSFGALNIYATEPDAFGDEEIKLLSQMRDNLCYGITTFRTRAGRKKEQELFRSLFDSAQSFIHIIDTRGKIMRTNPYSVRKSGYSEEELIGSSLSDYFTPASQEIFAAKFSTLLEQGYNSATVEYMCKGGVVIIMDCSGSAVYDKEGNIKYIMVYQQDITERKMAQDALKDSEARFRAIFNNAIDGILLADVENRKFISGNKSICRMLGYSPEEINKLSVLDIHPEKDLPYVIDMFEKQARGELLTAPSIPVKRKNGSVFYADINSSSLLLSGSFFLVGIFRDISRRRKIEKERQKLNKELLQKNRELQESNTALKVLLGQRENDKVEFEENILSNIKHLVLPYIEKLKTKRRIPEEVPYIKLIESNLNDIISPFSSRMSSRYLGFTPKEIQIANLIKEGSQDKDISEILHISVVTVKTHRQNIRKKLGIYGKRVNLRTHLLSFSK